MLAILDGKFGWRLARLRDGRKRQRYKVIALVLRLILQFAVAEVDEDRKRLFQIAGVCRQLCLLLQAFDESVQGLLVCECIAKAEEALQLTT